jgi:hypothetical protein
MLCAGHVGAGLPATPVLGLPPKTARPEGDANLRSLREVTRYTLKACDGWAGRVHDLLISSRAWQITHLVAEVGRWPSQYKVCLSIDSVHAIDWTRSTVRVDRTREQIHKETIEGQDLHATDP